MLLRGRTLSIPLGGAVALVACGVLVSLPMPALSQAFMLPFSGSTSSAGPAFQVTNTGSGAAIVGNAAQSAGVVGNGGRVGVYGTGGSGADSIGVYGQGNLYALEGFGGFIGCLASGRFAGVMGANGDAAAAPGPKLGVYAVSSNGTALRADTTNGLAGQFFGPVQITGNLTVAGNLTASGTKAFTIDHPEDPTNKYLVHASVESSEMKNLYDGVVTLDAQGGASVSVPSWFEALNKDFRYQLTAIGAPAPGLYVAEELKKEQFKIAGGKPGMKVSWQVTGVRQDAYSLANPLKVEVEKPAAARGTLLYSPTKKQVELPFGRFPHTKIDLGALAQAPR